MKILITGGAGFVGSHLVDLCLQKGHDVICIDKLDEQVHQKEPDYLNPAASYIFEDLRDLRWQDHFENVEAIVHLAAIGGVSRAAKQKEEVIANNCLGTSRLVAIAGSMRKLRRFIHISSFSVYGDNYQYKCLKCGFIQNGERTQAALEVGNFEVVCNVCQGETRVIPLDETAPVRPLEVYAASKYMQELALLGLPKSLPVHILRMSSVYGSRLRRDDGEATIIAKLLGWIQRDEVVPIFEDGQQLRDWVYVKDVCEGILALLEGKSAESLIHVCSGEGTSLVRACDLVGRSMGKAARFKITGNFRTGDIRHCIGNHRRFSALLGREPMSFERGLSEMLLEEMREITS